MEKKVMARCPETGEEVFTGVTVPDIATLRRTEYTEEDRAYTCSACGHVHHWEEEDVYLEPA